MTRGVDERNMSRDLRAPGSSVAFVDPVGQGFEVFLEPGPVGVEGHGRRGVPEHALHGFDRCPRTYGKRGGGVLQVVYEEVGDPDVFSCRVEHSLVEIPGPEWPPVER